MKTDTDIHHSDGLLKDMPPLSTRGFRELRVTPEMVDGGWRPGFQGVLSLSAMIAVCESVAVESVQSSLPIGVVSLGTYIGLKHTKVTPVGGVIYCETVLESTVGRKLRFGVSMFDEEGEIGVGEHDRIMVESGSLADRRGKAS